MAFENSQAFLAESKKLARTEQFECLARLEVSLDHPIKKVVSVNAQAKVNSLERNGDSLTVNGRTSYQVIYQTEDDSLLGAFADASWQQKTEAVGENVYVVPSVIENTVTGTSSTEMALSSLVVFDVYYVSSEKISPVDNLTEDYVVKQEEHDFYRVVNQVNQTINEVSEHEISGRVSSVLNYTGDVRLKSVTAGIDTLTFEGEVLVKVCAQEENKLIEFNKVVDFREEVACLSVVPSFIVDGEVNLSSIKVTASVNETDAKTNFVIALDLNALATVYSKETNNIIVDAFSTENNIESVTECVLTSHYIGEAQTMQSLQATHEVEKPLTEVLFISQAKPQVTDIEINDQETLVKGNTELKFIAKTEEGYQEQTIYIPFALAVQEAREDDKFDLSLEVRSIRLKGQNEVEVSYDLYLSVKMYKEEYVTYVSSISEAEPKEKNDAGIKVFITRKGEDLFSAAKCLSVRPEVILEQNPNLTENLDAGTRIIVYSGLDVNF